MEWKSTKGAVIEPGVLYAVIKQHGKNGPEWTIVVWAGFKQRVANPMWDRDRDIEDYDIYCELPRVE